MKKAMLFLGAFLFASSTSAAITSLVDGFENDVRENTGSGFLGLNQENFNNWEVVDGTVDLKKTGTWQVTCYAGELCVDLDGSTADAGKLRSKDEFEAGNYVVSFAYSGSQRDFADLVDSFKVQFLTAGGLIFEKDVAWSDDWTVFTTSLFLSDDAKIQFNVLGGDNVGVLVDNISVSQVPVPAAAFLFAPALLGFMGLRRRKAA
jgi:hypothetical protein